MFDPAARCWTKRCFEISEGWEIHVSNSDISYDLTHYSLETVMPSINMQICDSITGAYEVPKCGDL